MNAFDMLKQAGRIKTEVEDLKRRLAEDRYEANAGGGKVRVVVDGRQMLKELEIDPALLEGGARQVEELVMSAVGEAQKRSEARMLDALKKLTGGLLPI